MEFGAHLPILSFRHDAALPDLAAFTRTAREAGFTHLCSNDHLVFSRPWLDGLVALASVIGESGSMTLMTTVGLPVVRGTAAFAKAVAALDVLSGGRMAAGVGPGSSARDYDLMGLDFDRRWPLFEQAATDLREYLRGGAPPGKEPLHPLPVNRELPIWIGSWGSDVGLRRVARLADGWLASAYNTTPTAFAEGRRKLETLSSAEGRTPLPNALSTMWTYVSESRSECERYLEMLAAMLRRPIDALRPIVMVGGRDHCRELAAAYAAAGLQRMFIWPLDDEPRQLERFAEAVIPTA